MKRLLRICLIFCLAPLTVHADVLGEFVLEGTLGDKIPVEISFCVNGDDIAVGEIYYPKAKHPAPILIVGVMGESSSFYTFSEYQDDGTITGYISLEIEEDNNGPYFVKGTWINPKTQKEFPLKLVCTGTSVNVTKYLDYEDPHHIGREYSFKEWSVRDNCMMGGHVKFRGAGENKLHFEVCNVRHNIAEGKSDPDRPAVLGETTHDYFIYNDVNECGYSFSAHFFKRFVVLKTISDYNSLQCFGMGAAFDGVYMKIKQ